MLLAGTMLTLLLVVAGVSQYATTHTTGEFNTLLEDQVAIEEHAKDIKSLMLQSRRYEKDFLLRHDPKDVAKLDDAVDGLIVKAEEVRDSSRAYDHEETAVEAETIIESARVYRNDFLALTEAWKRKGLDHTSGLQGKFRQAAHELSDALVEHGLDEQMIDMLQCRRYEKDLQRTNADRYRVKLGNALDTFDRHLQDKPRVAAFLREPFEGYRAACLDFINAKKILESDGEIYQNIRTQAHNIGNVIKEYFVPEANEILLTIRKHEKDYLLRHDLNYAAKTRNMVAALLQAFVDAGVADEHREEIVSIAGNYQVAFDALVAEDEQIGTLIATMRDAVRRIEPLVEGIETTAEAQVRLGASETTDDAHFYSSVSYYAAGGVFVFGLVLAFSIARTITHPLRAAVDMLEDIAEGEGDLTRRLDANGRDELGRLSRAFNTFVDKLQGVIREVASQSQVLTGASEELSSTATGLSEGADNMQGQSASVAAAAEEMSVNMETMASSSSEMTQNIQSVSHAVGEMNTSIGEISRNANQSSSVVSEAALLVDQSNDTIGKLGSAADEIGKVIEVIQDIAEQTNLLALNATIEAARAGEAGKGFAVVATEVKELARQTADATEDIRTRIEAIQKSSVDSVGAIGEIGKVVGSVREVSQTIAAAVEEQSATVATITQSMSSATAAAESISSGVQESAAASREITRNMTGVDEGARQTASGAAQTRTAGDKLGSMAGSIQSAIGAFRIGN